MTSGPSGRDAGPGKRPATRRRTDPAAGREALAKWLAGDHSTPTRRTAVRYALEELAERHPGHSVEVRVPPDGAVQCIEGPRHTRGTPPNVIETDAVTWLELATGQLAWADAVAAARVRASGLRADLAPYVPVVAPGAPPA